MARETAQRRGYNARWRKARRNYLQANPRCAHPGCDRRAVHLHHTTPHKGDPTIFWDKSRWQGLCDEHHNRDAQQIECRGYSDRLGPDGIPLDPNHPANRPEVP